MYGLSYNVLPKPALKAIKLTTGSVIGSVTGLATGLVTGSATGLAKDIAMAESEGFRDL
jgi:hypothetical protein